MAKRADPKREELFDKLPMSSSVAATATTVSSAYRRRILLCACLTFFLRFVAAGAFYPYLFLWLTHNGHSAPTAATVALFGRVTGFVSPPLIGGVADAWHGGGGGEAAAAAGPLSC